MLPPTDALRFALERDDVGDWWVVDHRGKRRPATPEEVLLWVALQAALAPVEEEAPEKKCCRSGRVNRG